jgi:hypothetical protein
LAKLFSNGARSSRHRGWTFTDARHGFVGALLKRIWSIHYGRGAGMTVSQAAAILGLRGPGSQPRRHSDDLPPESAGGATRMRAAVTKARAVLLSALDD